MSGGSFDYLCYKNAEQILSDSSKIKTIRKMAKLLFASNLPYARDAASETLSLAKDMDDAIQAFDDVIQAFQKRIDMLRDIWEDAEWVCSHDREIGDLKESLRQWHTTMKEEDFHDL